ncbi:MULTISPECIES: GtrA family protein [unclassified Rhizobium]|uniref:GtrA family protein n=1 Tax=unclassified Rhizobium TaxID=2613769 RepID=UPI001FD84D40|nr:MULTISPECIES: GtrA family protein [unclassified Rhizobium]
MADGRPARGAPLLRFAALLLAGVAVDAALTWLLLDLTPWPGLARTVGLAAALATQLMLLRFIDVTAQGRLSIGRTGVTAIILIALIVNIGLYAALTATLGDLQPMAATVFAAIAAMFFALFGYARFAFRA